MKEEEVNEERNEKVQAPQEEKVTRESVLKDIDDMLNRMGNVPGVENVKAMIAELKGTI